MPTGRYMFIPFLRTKSQMGQTKNRSNENSHFRLAERTNITERTERTNITATTSFESN